MTSRTELLHKVLEAILKLSPSNRSINLEDISSYTLISREQVREILNTLNLSEEDLPLRGEKKVELVLRGLRLGINGEVLARYLSWREFESLVTRLLSEIGYEAVWNVRLSHEGRRIQLDVLAYNGSLLLIIDCKRWNRPPSPSAESSIKESQEKKLSFLKELVENIGWEGKTHNVYLVPIVLSLYQPSRPILEGHVFASIRNLSSVISFVENSFFRLRSEVLKISKDLTLTDILQKLKKR